MVRSALDDPTPATVLRSQATQRPYSRHLAVLLVASALLPATRVRATSPKGLTLEDCLGYAHVHNLDLRVARTETAIVRARMHEAGARYLPSLSLDGYYTTYDTTPSQNVSVPPNLRVTVPGGQTVPVTLHGPLTVQTTPRDPSDMKLALSQPLFTSGKLTNAFTVRREEATQATLQETQTQAQVDLEIERAFDALLLAEEALALQEEIGPQTSNVLADVEHRFAEQSASRLELLEAQDARTRAQMPLLRARQDLRTRRDDLSQLLAWEEDRALVIQGHLTVVPLHPDPRALVQRALADRAELRVLAQELKVKEEELLSVKLANTPSVSLVGNYEFVQRARNDLPENVLSGGVALTWPIFEGGTILPRLQAASLAVDAVRLRIQQRRSRIEFEVEKAVGDLAVAAEAHETQQRDVETAGERVRMAAAGAQAGTLPPVGLVRERMALLDARLTEAELRFEHVIARARLEYAVGAAPGHLEL